MKVKNPFISEFDEYKPHNGYLDSYFEQIRTVIKKQDPTATDEEIDAFIESEVKAKMRDPQVRLLSRDFETQDRSVSIVPLSALMAQSKEEDLIMTPSLAFNYPHHVRRSNTGQYITVGLAKRNEQRRLAFEHQFKGNHNEYEHYWSEQNTTKVKNNSLSGTRRSEYTILNLASGHSQLTSGCRMGTSTANLHNEKFISGNRYYYNLDMVEANLAYVMASTDRDMVGKAMTEFNLYVPSEDDILDCIGRSADRYFTYDARSRERLRRIVSTMDDIDKVSFMYSGDLYHLYQYNKEFVSEFLLSLAHLPEEPIMDPELQDAVMDTEFDIISHASLRCSDIMAGRQVSTVKKEDPNGYGILVATVANVRRVLDKHATMAKAFWVSKIAPSSVGQAAHKRRTVVPISDTDSTIFTVENWVKDLTGTLEISPYTNGVGSTVSLMTALIVRHWMRQLMTNINVPVDYRFALNMTGEYYMPVVALPTVAKHYGYLNAAEDGNVYTKAKLVLKGVNLRNSTWAPPVRKHHAEYVEGFLNDVNNNLPITIASVLDPVYEMEMRIKEDIRKGGVDYLGYVRINDASNYAKPMSSNYMHYDLWENVFAPKYGSAGELPITGLKVPMSLRRPTDLRNYMLFLKENFPDTHIRMEDWLLKSGRRDFTNFTLPYSYMSTNGIPPEIEPFVDVRGIIRGQMSGYYLFLTSFNLHYGDGNDIRLVSDEYTPANKELTG